MPQKMRPPLVIDRGDLPEAANGAGFVLPLPPGYAIAAKQPLEPAAVGPWREVVERLHDDEAFYKEGVCGPAWQSRTPSARTCSAPRPARGGSGCRDSLAEIKRDGGCPADKK